MKVVKSKANGIRHLLEVRFESQEVESARGEVAREVNRLARIPGFRPGKAPIGILEKRYGGDIVHRLLRRLREEALRAVLDSGDLQVFSFESIEPQTYHRGKELAFQVTLDVVPEIELPDYDSIPLPPEDTTVGEAEIDEVMAMLRNHRAQFVPVDRPVQKGDTVKLNYIGYLEDGRPMLEQFPDLKIWADQRGTLEEAGGKADHGIREIIDGIIGLEVGGKRTIDVRFAPDFRIKALAGLQVSYEVEVLAIHEKKLPPMDGTFFLHFGVESETQLRDRIHEYVRQSKARESALQRRKAIGDFLESRIDCPLPESAVRIETDRIFDHLLQDGLDRGTVKEDGDREALRNRAARMAREKVKMTIIIDQIAKKENIRLEERELYQLIIEGAQANGVRPQQVVEVLKKDSRALEDLRKRGLAIKTIDFILQKIVRRAETPHGIEPVRRRKSSSIVTEKSATASANAGTGEDEKAAPVKRVRAKKAAAKGTELTNGEGSKRKAKRVAKSAKKEE